MGPADVGGSPLGSGSTVEVVNTTHHDGTDPDVVSLSGYSTLPKPGVPGDPDRSVETCPGPLRHHLVVGRTPPPVLNYGSSD